MKKAITYMLICFSAFLFAQNNDTLFKDANTFYNDGKFAEAIDKYDAILKTGVHSTELYFNLANAHYKLNNIAPSIYYYEKALQLDPLNTDVKNNLAFAQNMTIDAFDKVPEIGFSKIRSNVISCCKTDTWAMFSIGLVILFVALFLTYIFSYGILIKRFSFIASIISLLVVIFSIAMAFQSEALDNNNNPAIVFEAVSSVRTDPNANSEELFKLHEGTKVQVLESYSSWFKVKLPNTNEGWVNSKDLKLLKF